MSNCTKLSCRYRHGRRGARKGGEGGGVVLPWLSLWWQWPRFALWYTPHSHGYYKLSHGYHKATAKFLAAMQLVGGNLERRKMMKCSLYALPAVSEAKTS